MSLFQELNCSGVNDFLSLIGLCILAYEDYLYGEIHYRYLILLVGFSFPLGYLLMLLVVICYPLLEKYIGGADLLVFCLLYTNYGFQTNLMIFLSALFALIYCLVFKQKQVRFIPFILLAFLIC